MNTVLQARPRNFVSTPTLERTAFRALRYLKSGYSVHLKGPAGTGKTTLALHLADLLGRPIMLLFGDDEFKTSDLIGSQSGYTRKKVVDNFIHSVMKVEDELRHNWIDARLTLACREGFTLVYDEFNRSRPEVNNVLLSALEEKLLVLPPTQNRSEYIRVSPHFRAIFTSNPEEYCGVHGTQDALQDRLITINMPEPDELAQQQILAQKVGIDPSAALQIVRLVKAFQADAAPDMISSLRPSLMIATICNDHGIIPLAENSDFRDVCSDILLDRSKHPLPEATRRLWDLFNQFVVSQAGIAEQLRGGDAQRTARLHGEDDDSASPSPVTSPDPKSPAATTEGVSAPAAPEDLTLQAPDQTEVQATISVLEESALESLAVEESPAASLLDEKSQIEAVISDISEAPIKDVSELTEPALEQSTLRESVTAESGSEHEVEESAELEEISVEPVALVGEDHPETIASDLAESDLEPPPLEASDENAGEISVIADLASEDLASEDLAPEDPISATDLPETTDVEDGSSLTEPLLADIPLEDEAALAEVTLEEPASEAVEILEEMIPDAMALAEETLSEEAFTEDSFAEDAFLEEMTQEIPAFEEEAFLESSLADEPTFTEEPFWEEATQEPLAFAGEADSGEEPSQAVHGMESPASDETATPVTGGLRPEPVVLTATERNGSATVTPPAVGTPVVQAERVTEERIFDFLDNVGSASFSRIETDLGLTRFQVVNALKSMLDQGLIEKGADGQRPSVYQIRAEYQELL